MATKQKAGPPYWTYVVGAIAGLGGLAWAVISNFVPKLEPAKPAVMAPANTPPNVSVTGDGSIGVGTMSGGTITGGATAPASPASATR